MINVNKAKAMSKGWKIAVSVDAKRDLDYDVPPWHPAHGGA